MEETVRLIVLADDPLARAGLAALLATLPGCAVVDQGSSTMLFDPEAGLSDVQADLIVWDVGRGGWEAAERSDADRLDMESEVLALVPDEETAALAWRLGARGILTREMDEERVAAAVSAVAAGLVVIAPSLASAISRGEVNAGPVASDLTPREMEVLVFLAEGLTNKAIAHNLGISEHTVKFHVNSILNKLDAQSRTDAVVRATRLGLIAL